MSRRFVTGVVVVLVLIAWCATAAPPVEAAGPSGSAHGDAADSGDGHGGKGDINPLEVRGDLALWTGVVFLLLLAVLWKYAWGPIADGLDKREKRIADEIASAEKTNVEARELLAEYQQKLAASQGEIRQMLEAARRDAEQVGQQLVDKAREEARAEHQRALAEIELATADALKELAERSAGLAVELAGKIVDARLDPTAHAGLIEQAVADFTRTRPGDN